MRFNKILKAVVLMFPLAAAAAPLTPVELTKEDIISIYKVPVAANPASKMEWVFPHEKYVRYLLEERASKDLPWKTREGYAYNVPVAKALFIVQIADRHAGPADHNLWLINTRLGGSSTHSGETLSGWAGCNNLIPVDTPDYSELMKPDDPDNIYLLTTPHKQYRIRLESSDAPFPEKEPIGNRKP
jgi:hypothetical protein